MVAEGEVFDVSRVINAAGLTGALTSTIRWGDGTQSAGTVSPLPATGPIRVKFDYSLDSSGFFSAQERKTILELAANSIVSRFNDDLAALPAPTPSSVPANQDTWSAVFSNPTSGAIETRKDLVVAANEIIIYAGARNLPGNTRGFGGPGGFTSFGSSAWNDLIKSRGEAGALANPQTDFSPWGGSVTFDNADTNWYFGVDPVGITSSQVDFLTVATHELTHVFGFGFNPPATTPPSAPTSWQNLSSSGNFTGPKAVASFGGTNASLQAGDRSHWREGILSGGRETLMDPTIPGGERTLLSPLDFAALDDIGWDVDVTNVTVTGSHTYADNGTFPVEIVLRSASGELVSTLSANITDVAPTLTIVGNQPVIAGQPLSITGQIADPGADTFTYSIAWGDASTADTGDATTTFNESHVYSEPGSYTVRVTVTDKVTTTASDVETYTATVTAPPTLSLALDVATIAEDAGADAVTLTITRSGPALTTAQTITLLSSDITEATVPATVVIPAGETSATVNVRAVDDFLLDGEITLMLTASATALGLAAVSTPLKVTDRESIVASFGVASIREDAATDLLLLTVTRSNTDTTEPLDVAITGGDMSQLVLASPIVIPAGQGSVTVPLTPTNDTAPERTTSLAYTFTASGYATGGTASIDILDDEPPKFRNPNMSADVDGNDDVTAGDAALIIYELFIRSNGLTSSGSGETGGTMDPFQLDPAQDPEGVFIDVNGDYSVTAADALAVINALFLKDFDGTSGGSGELLVTESDLLLPGTAMPAPEAYDRAITGLIQDDELRRRTAIQLF